MLSLRKPTPASLSRFLKAQAELGFTYDGVGATAHRPPQGYVVDRSRIQLGSGEAVFEAAKDALRGWEQFRLGWVDAWSLSTPLQPGEVVAVMGHAIGLWWLNACRIVYIVDEVGPLSRFGFAYGTLPGHIESGEELFLLEWDHENDSVWFSILAFSRPNHFLTRLGYPLVRRNQKRFGRDAATALFRAVNRATKVPAVCQTSC